MKLIVAFLLFTAPLFAQENWEDEVLKSRSEKALELSDTSKGLLNSKDLAHFKGLNYFDIDSTFRIKARFKKKKGRKFKMPTSTERTPIYRRYGYVYFTIDGTEHKLTVYQNMGLRKNPEYKDYLFLPFRDATCPDESYGGGRYLDMNIPEGQELILDFNMAYNPYCAYSHRYSCPIPPVENTLDIPISAGEKIPHYFDEGH